MRKKVGGCISERRDDPLPTNLAARSAFYRFLAAVYLGPPAPALVRQVADADNLAQLSRLFGDEVVTKLADFAVNADDEIDLPSLEREYMDLFAVPTGRYVTPFEDVYRGTAGDGQPERGPLLGERAIAVKRIYRAAGAGMDPTCKELPTHIGVELSFMSFLCGNEAEALRQERARDRSDQETGEVPSSTCYRELQRRFLQDHLNDWFPRLSEAIQTYSTSPFYKGLALLTEEFLARDTAHLVSRSGSVGEPA